MSRDRIDTPLTFEELLEEYVCIKLFYAKSQIDLCVQLVSFANVGVPSSNVISTDLDRFVKSFQPEKLFFLVDLPDAGVAYQYRIRNENYVAAIAHALFDSPEPETLEKDIERYFSRFSTSLGYKIPRDIQKGGWMYVASIMEARDNLEHFRKHLHPNLGTLHTLAHLPPPQVTGFAIYIVSKSICISQDNRLANMLTTSEYKKTIFVIYDREHDSYEVTHIDLMLPEPKKRTPETLMNLPVPENSGKLRHFIEWLRVLKGKYPELISNVKLLIEADLGQPIDEPLVTSEVNQIIHCLRPVQLFMITSSLHQVDTLLYLTRKETKQGFTLPVRGSFIPSTLIAALLHSTITAGDIVPEMLSETSSSMSPTTDTTKTHKEQVEVFLRENLIPRHLHPGERRHLLPLLEEEVSGSNKMKFSMFYKHPEPKERGIQFKSGHDVTYLPSERQSTCCTVS